MAMLNRMVAMATTTMSSIDRKSTRLNSSHLVISYAVFCLKKKKKPDAIEHLATIHAPCAAVEVERHPITEMFFMRTPHFLASAVLLAILLHFLLFDVHLSIAPVAHRRPDRYRHWLWHDPVH